jgi:hypothetical protein
MTVELRLVSGSSDRLDAWADGFRIGGVQMVVTGTMATMAAELDGGPALQDDVGDLVLAAVAEAEERGATDVALLSQSLLLRHEARRMGFRGPLRAPLAATTGAIARSAMIVDTAGVQDRRDRMAWLVAALDDVGVASMPARPAGALGRLTRRLAGGVGDTLEVVVEGAPGRTFVVSAPDRADTMPEAVALAADTTSAVLRRFPGQAAGVKFVYFDRAIYEMKAGGRTAGMTEGSAPSIHLNVMYVSAEASLEMTGERDKDRTEHSGRARPPPTFTALDHTVAHELWHRIEMVFEARDYRSSIDLRRQIGRSLGVETLEHAVKGGSAKAPAPWQAAYRRLMDEVSPYATTGVREATAEMFKLWWCRSGPTSPVVTRFGELVDQFFPR